MSYPDIVYHMAHQSDWEAALASGQYEGSPDDKRDGFIHLSGPSQIRGSANKHRAGQKDLLLITFEAAKLPKLIWEANAPGGMEFPHHYGPIDPSLATKAEPLPLDEAGLHVFPLDVPLT